MNCPIVTRFAPSPTGRLHLGHALAAWTARQLATAQGGQCLLRIEDLDTARCRTEYVQGIMEDLAWLGIEFDGPVIFQSQRLSLYEQVLQRLQNLDVLYPCFCTRKEILREIGNMVSAPQGEKVNIYPGTCRNLSTKQRLRLMQSGKPYSWRLHCSRAAALTGPLLWHDIRFGDCICHPEQLGDVVLARKDCTASYHIAVVTDDAAQSVTHVSRGEDLFSVTGIHRTLQALLGLPVPKWYHHRLVTDSTGKRLAKRYDSLSLQSMREAGMSPARILERIATY